MHSILFVEIKDYSLYQDPEKATQLNADFPGFIPLKGRWIQWNP